MIFNLYSKDVFCGCYLVRYCIFLLFKMIIIYCVSMFVSLRLIIVLRIDLVKGVLNFNLCVILIVLICNSEDVYYCVLKRLLLYYNIVFFIILK